MLLDLRTCASVQSVQHEYLPSHAPAARPGLESGYSVLRRLRYPRRVGSYSQAAPPVLVPPRASDMAGRCARSAPPFRGGPAILLPESSCLVTRNRHYEHELADEVPHESPNVPMTGAEREDFRELRLEMREGFRDMSAGLNKISERVGSLELTRAETLGAKEVRANLKTIATSERRWRVGLAVSVIVAVALGLANLIVNVAQKAP